jgi:hypothetical protein
VINKWEENDTCAAGEKKIHFEADVAIERFENIFTK